MGLARKQPGVVGQPARVPMPQINPPAPYELARVFALATTADIDLADYILVAAATGTRRSELVALRWSDVDLGRGVVTISHGIVSGAEGLVEKDTKTHASRRVSLDPTTVDALRAHRARAEERARVCEFGLSGGSFVFSYEVDGSKPWFPDSVSRSFTRLCRRAGLKGVRLRDLRHYVVISPAVVV